MHFPRLFMSAFLLALAVVPMSALEPARYPPAACVSSTSSPAPDLCRRPAKP